MTYKDFMIAVQQYYGVYENNVVKHDVYEYVKKTYYPSELPQLLQNLKKHYSRKWKVKPDIAIIVETEKKYQIIRYIQNIREIPDIEMKNQITKGVGKEEQDYSEELHQLWVDAKKKAEGKMKAIRNGNVGE